MTEKSRMNNPLQLNHKTVTENWFCLNGRMVEPAALLRKERLSYCKFFGLEVNLEQKGSPKTFHFNPNSFGSWQ